MPLSYLVDDNIYPGVAFSNQVLKCITMVVDVNENSDDYMLA